MWPVQGFLSVHECGLGSVLIAGTSNGLFSIYGLDTGEPSVLLEHFAGWAPSSSAS